jgi:site-specific DNA-methyltransferase (adenine-specific)
MDCLEGMKLIPNGSIDMILCDLPFAVTANKWDLPIDLEKLWEQYERIIKENGAIVLNATQPFTSKLVMSNPKLFRYEWIWDKTRGSNFQLAKKMPMKSHENILVFYKKLPTYNPQFWYDKPYKVSKKDGIRTNEIEGIINQASKFYPTSESTDGRRYPLSILTYKRDSDRLHPTQKPLSLFEYLLLTYTNEGMTVLDNCMGSGTTAVAATLNKRKWIGFETESEYIKIANKRLDNLEIKE